MDRLIHHLQTYGTNLWVKAELSGKLFGFFKLLLCQERGQSEEQQGMYSKGVYSNPRRV